MTYEPLPLQCDCGQAAVQIQNVGLTDCHELVVHCWCPRCNKPVYLFKSLGDCWRDCPPGREPQDAVPCLQGDDEAFLRRLGIAPPEEGWWRANDDFIGSEYEGGSNAID